MLPTVVRSIRAVNTDSIGHPLVDRDVENGRVDFPPYDGTDATVVVLGASVFGRHCGMKWLNREEYAKTLRGEPTPADVAIPVPSRAAVSSTAPPRSASSVPPRS